MTEESVEIDIDALQPNPLQPRGQLMPDTLVELADSIREHGILEPIVVAKTPAGYQIIAGERRWRAAKLAGMTKIPATVRETTGQGMLEMAIVENAQRVDLNPLERAQAFRRLMEEFGLSAVDISQRVAKSSSYISNTLRLLDLPDALKDGLLSNTLTEGHAKAMLGLEDVNLIVKAYRTVLAENLGVRATEELVRRMKSGAGIQAKTKHEHVKGEDVTQAEENIESAMGCKTQIFKAARGGRFVVFFNSEDEFAKIRDKLLS